MKPNPGRHFRVEVSRLGFIVLAATFLALINSSSIWRRVAQFVRESSGAEFAVQTLFEFVLLWSAMAAVLLLAIISKHVLKVWTLLLVCAGAFASYYVAQLNVGIDADVIRSILSTDRQEVAEFVDPLSLLLLVVVGGGVAAILTKITIVSRRERQRPSVFAPRPVAVYSFLGVVSLAAFTSHAALGQYYAIFPRQPATLFSPKPGCVRSRICSRHLARPRRCGSRHLFAVLYRQSYLR